jgi:predicted esterase
MPVLYVLHGWVGTPQAMIAATTPYFSQAFAKGQQPFIEVFPDGNASTHPDSEWADSSDGSAMIETWLIKKVIPAVEGDYPRSKTSRSILGFSMGGYGASIIALHHPQLFASVVSVAGYFKIDDLTGVFSSYKKRLMQEPANYLRAARQLRWLLIEGKYDYSYPVAGQARAWSALLTKNKINNKVIALPAGHSATLVSTAALTISKWLNLRPLTYSSSQPPLISSANLSSNTLSVQPIPSASALPISDAPSTPSTPSTSSNDPATSPVLTPVLPDSTSGNN